MQLTVRVRIMSRKMMIKTIEKMWEDQRLWKDKNPPTPVLPSSISCFIFHIFTTTTSCWIITQLDTVCIILKMFQMGALRVTVQSWVECQTLQTGRNIIRAKLDKTCSSVPIPNFVSNLSMPCLLCADCKNCRGRRCCPLVPADCNLWNIILTVVLVSPFYSTLGFLTLYKCI